MPADSKRPRKSSASTTLSTRTSTVSAADDDDNDANDAVDRGLADEDGASKRRDMGSSYRHLAGTSAAGEIQAPRAAGYDPSKGAAYNDTVSKRAFIAMKAFFDEIFG